MRIPLARPYFDKSETSGLEKVIKSGWVMQGPQVERFERAFAGRVGAAKAVAVSSGTTALHLALKVMGVGPGDEVITTAFSFIATANSILYCGAMPVFCDIDEKTYNLDAEKVEAFIEKKCVWKEKGQCLINKRTKKRIKAIMPVDQVGMPGDLDRFAKIARRYNLKVVEDAACALGSRYKKNYVGSISDISCFSFHPRKIITTAEGGMITTNDKKIERILKALRSHGDEKGRYVFIGYNYRMTDLAAAIGIAQMKKLNYIISRRRSIAKKYNSAFKDIEMLQIPFVPEYAEPNFQSYIVRVSPKEARDRIVRKLQAKGIAARPGITAIHKEPPYQRLMEHIRLPLTEEANMATFMLPIYPSLTEKEHDYVIDSTKKICRRF